jgi:hypothetical protein
MVFTSLLDMNDEKLMKPETELSEIVEFREP